MIPYLTHQFNFKHKPILILRHPINTCLSQIKLFGKKHKKLKHQIPDCIYNERYVEHHSYLQTLETDLELRVAYWCLNNVSTINQLHDLDVCVVFYEDLILNPKNELVRILKEIGLEKFNTQLDHISIRKESKTNYLKKLKSNTNLQLNQNLNELNSDSKHKILSLIHI